MSDMHPEDIKAAVRKTGFSLASLAREKGMNKQTLSLAIQARVSEKAERVIADCIRMDPADIWPSRYGRDGQRINFRRSSAA